MSLTRFHHCGLFTILVTVLLVIPLSAESDFAKLRQQAYSTVELDSKITLYRQSLAAWKASDSQAARDSVSNSLAFHLDKKAWQSLAIKQDKAATLAILPIIVPLLEEALQAAPLYAPPYRSLGYAYYKAELYEKAIPILRQGLDLPNIASDVLRFWWTSMNQLKRYAESLAYLQTLVATKPDYNCVYYLSKTYQAINQVPEAIAVLTSYLQKDQLLANDLWLYSQLMTLYNLAGDWSAAWNASQSYLARGGDPNEGDFLNYYFYIAKLSAQECFGLEQYDQAETCYLAACDCLARSPKLQTQDAAQREPIDYRLDLVRERRLLGRISPRQSYRILALTISQVNASFTDLFGRAVHYQLPNLDPVSLKWRNIAQNHLARSVETWSHGQMTIAFENQTIDAAITGFSQNWLGNDPSSQKEMRTARIDSIQPTIGPLLYQKRNDFDSLIIYYNGSGGAAAGLHGRSLQLSYQPGIVSKAWRGVLDIPLNFISSYEGPSILLHEFFHNLESICSIKPEHGFLPANRKYFPAWTDSSEISFYRWHFDHTLAPKGWENISFRQRWPDQTVLP